MARTESKTLTCHPAAEQEIVDIHQKFHWSLTNSQEVKTASQGLEKGGWMDDDIHSLGRAKHYVKLTFSRNVDLPNLSEVKRLEAAYFGLPSPNYPSLFPVHIILWIVLVLIYGLGIVLWLAYYLVSYRPKMTEAKRVSKANARERLRIVSEVAKFG